MFSGNLDAQMTFPARQPRVNPPARDEVRVSAILQETEGPLSKLRGRAHVETTEMMIEADEIDYNQNTHYAEARGNVKFDHFERGEHIEADRVEYNLESEEGRYFNLRGYSPAKIEARPGVLTTSNPFSFEAKWAERFKDRYVLHDGMVTDCRLPKPWWILRAPIFDVVPRDRAVAHNSIFWLKRVPLFYTPYFYRSLERMPRKSGFLTPNLGNSSRRGSMLGIGYFWAINRSYDAMYRAQWFTDRGVAHHVDFRGKPNDRTDFDFILYGVNDRGLKLDNGEIRKEGGYLITFDGKSDLGHGFYARTSVNYLSSFEFRQAFTESFYEAIFSESHSIGFVTKHWSTFGFNAVFNRNENFHSTLPDDKIIIRKLPSFEFNSRDREISTGPIPVWVSFDSSAGLLHRSQLSFQTRQYVERVDVEPRITSSLAWKDFRITPSFSFRETSWGSSYDNDGKITGDNILRSSREFDLDLAIPSLARIFDAPKWMGTKLKHVIEPRARFRYVTGVDNFNRIVRFDETELLSNTNEAEISIVNRLFAKRKDGRVEEILTWEVTQRRFFDPTFGGAIQPGQRNVLLSSATLTGYTFLDQPRNYSPVASYLRAQPDPRIGVEWRTDYDPLRGHIVNSGLSADGRFSKYFISLGHNHVRSVNVLQPSANQFRGLFGIGQDNKRGWNAAFSAIYDFRTDTMQYATTQVTYNTDCCGFSMQYRRFGFGTRNENQFRIAFAIANIGSFGTLKRQERIF